MMRKIFPSHAMTLGLVTGAIIALNMFLSVVVSPHITDGLSLQRSVIVYVQIVFALFIYASLIAGVVLLLRRKLFLSACYLAACAATYASGFAVASLKDNRMVFPARSHREIADIYHRQEVDFDVTNRTPHRVFLDEQCHPPGGCGCWVLIDPDHRSGVENDVGGWRRPTSPMLPLELLPVRFALVHVRALDSSAYSVLGCGIDTQAPLIPH